MYIRSGYTDFIAKPFYLSHIQVTEMKCEDNAVFIESQWKGLAASCRPAGVIVQEGALAGFSGSRTVLILSHGMGSHLYLVSELTPWGLRWMERFLW